MLNRPKSLVFRLFRWWMCCFSRKMRKVLWMCPSRLISGQHYCKLLYRRDCPRNWGLATTHIYNIISWVYRSCDWVNQPGSQHVTTTSAATIFLPPIIHYIVISVIHQWSRPLWDVHPKKSLERSAIRVVAPFPGCPGLNWSEILVSCLVISHLSSPVDQLHIQVGYAILHIIIYIYIYMCI